MKEWERDKTREGKREKSKRYREIKSKKESCRKKKRKRDSANLHPMKNIDLLIFVETVYGSFNGSFQVLLVKNIEKETFKE